MPAHRTPENELAAMDKAPRSLDELNRLIEAAPPMVAGGTRAVLGEGPVGAAIAFVGEQPGDQEDLQGRPFIGPAGQIFDRALAEAGIERGETYVTNAVNTSSSCSAASAACTSVRPPARTRTTAGG